MMCDFIETTNAECANTDCEECLIKYFEEEVEKYKNARSFKEYLGVEGFGLEQIRILNVLTKEQFTQNSYKVEG